MSYQHNEKIATGLYNVGEPNAQQVKINEYQNYAIKAVTKTLIIFEYTHEDSQFLEAIDINTFAKFEIRCDTI